jgi:hypothetical protein
MTMRSFLLPGLLLSFIAAAIMLDGCSKSSPAANTYLTGKWRLSYTRGGIAGITKKYSPFTAPVLDLRSDSTYRRTSAFTLLESGTYSLTVINTMDGKDTVISFHTATNPNNRSGHKFMDILTITDGFMDGFTDVYLKIP